MADVELCPRCLMAVADDLYRDEDGDAWHGECFAEWAAEREAADEEEQRRAAEGSLPEEVDTSG